MKTLSIFLSLINSLVAGLIITFNISSSGLGHFDFWWLVIQSAASLLVIAFGIITWLTSIRCTSSVPVHMGGITLAIMGAVIIVWSYHLAVINGREEYFMAGYGASLMVQGLSSLLGYAGQAGNAVA